MLTEAEAKLMASELMEYESMFQCISTSSPSIAYDNLINYMKFLKQAGWINGWLVRRSSNTGGRGFAVELKLKAFDKFLTFQVLNPDWPHGH